MQTKIRYCVVADDGWVLSRHRSFEAADRAAQKEIRTTDEEYLRIEKQIINAAGDVDGEVVEYYTKAGTN